MGSITLTNPVAGTKIQAGPLATNFSLLQALLNGNIDAANLDDMGASSGQALIWNGSVWAPTAIPSPTSYRKVTSKTVNNTVAATDLLNGEITIGAGVMGTTKMCRLTAFGDLLNNASGAQARFQLVFGGTTLFDTGAWGAITPSAGRTGWKIVVEILNVNSASAQASTFDLRAGQPATPGTQQSGAFTTGQGVVEVQGLGFRALGTSPSSALDTSTSKALVLNVINAAASASCETRLFGALVEIV